LAQITMPRHLTPEQIQNLNLFSWRFLIKARSL
jgi:hypothetical protein